MQQQVEEATRTYEDRCDFITVGGFKHPPNVDSIRLLKQRIWPRIRSYLPTARLHVYGAYPTNEILSMHNIDEGFVVHGHVDDDTLNQALMEKRVCLAPLRFGAGIKGKIVDSWGCGLPVVTTPIGAEGMSTSDGGQSRQNDRDDWGGYIASNEEDFVQASLRLYTSKELWSQSQRKGVELFNILFNKEHNLSVIDEAMGNAMMNLHERRRQDITGQLLWHQSNRSTEYFSKWIELKEEGVK
jgi:glycosyltransferase involved in cell wall biosynthesis